MAVWLDAYPLVSLLKVFFKFDHEKILAFWVFKCNPLSPSLVSTCPSRNSYLGHELVFQLALKGRLLSGTILCSNEEHFYNRFRLMLPYSHFPCGLVTAQHWVLAARLSWLWPVSSLSLRESCSFRVMVMISLCTFLDFLEPSTEQDQICTMTVQWKHGRQNAVMKLENLGLHDQNLQCGALSMRVSV